MKAILVSACLLGTPCRYDGKSKPVAAVQALEQHFRIIPICPEVMGGLPTPRTPSEICGACVKMRDGRDVTDNYRRGAEEALRLARENGATVAILKEKSPSCGHGTVYDGTFTGTLVPGNGICAALLLENGIQVLTERDIESGVLPS